MYENVIFFNLIIIFSDTMVFNLCIDCNLQKIQKWIFIEFPEHWRMEKASRLQMAASLSFSRTHTHKQNRKSQSPFQCLTHHRIPFELTTTLVDSNYINVYMHALHHHTNANQPQILIWLVFFSWEEVGNNSERKCVCVFKFRQQRRRRWRHIQSLQTQKALR